MEDDRRKKIQLKKVKLKEKKEKEKVLKSEELYKVIADCSKWFKLNTNVVNKIVDISVKQGQAAENTLNSIQLNVQAHNLSGASTKDITQNNYGSIRGRSIKVLWVLYTTSF